MLEAFLSRRAALSFLATLVLCLVSSRAGAADDDAIRFEVTLLPSVVRYSDLFAKPGYLAVALENNGLSPSLSSKLQVREGGNAAEIRNATFRFVSRRGALFVYEAAVILNLGVSDTRLAFPVSIDLSRASAGKADVMFKPPLARLLPAEIAERINVKTQMLASASAQQRMLAYLDGAANAQPKGSGPEMLFEQILIDAYNKGGGSAVVRGHDAGDAVPLSEQWMLLLTLAIWFLVVPGFIFSRRIRRGRAGSA